MRDKAGLRAASVRLVRATGSASRCNSRSELPTLPPTESARSTQSSLITDPVLLPMRAMLSGTRRGRATPLIRQRLALGLWGQRDEHHSRNVDQGHRGTHLAVVALVDRADHLAGHQGS